MPRPMIVMGAPAPSARAEAILTPLRAAVDEVWRQVGPMPVAQRRVPVGRGAGGDQTVRIDAVAEEIVLNALRALAPALGGLRVVSEEAGEVDLGAERPVAVVDPIDGSLNAKRGLPTFATSIALADGPTLGDVWLGLLRDHATGEHIVAERGRGAWIDGRPLGPPQPDPGLELVLVEGAAPRPLARAAAGLGDEVRRVRALGSLALSLTHVAAGRADALLCLGRARAVDYAAAQLVAREAGVLVGLPTEADRDHSPLDTVSSRPLVAARDPATLARLGRLLARRA